MPYKKEINPFAKKEIYGSETLYRELGYYVSKLGDYERSLKFFDEAIKNTPIDKRALIGRGRSKGKTLQIEGALEDVRKVLELEPDDLEVLADKALCLYLSSEFEEALVENTRLDIKRQKPEHFAMGIMHCTDAIKNAIGERTGRPLRDYFKIIRKLAWRKHYAEQKCLGIKINKSKKKKFKQMAELQDLQEVYKPKFLLNMKNIKESQIRNELEIRDSLHSKKTEEDIIPPLSESFSFGPLQRYTSNLKNFMAEKYLDAMYLDKIFLETIQTAEGASCPNLEGSKKIKQTAKKCYKTVFYMQELLRKRRPFYFIKYQEGKVSESLQKRQQRELEQKQGLIKREADSILNKMLIAYDNKKIKLLLDLAGQLHSFINKSKKDIPDISIYMNQIYDKVCKGFYEMYRLNKSYNLSSQNRRIYALLGLPLSRKPSRDSVISEFEGVVLNYKKEIALLAERLQRARSPEETCWYYHELCRYHLEIKQCELTRVYARKCMQIAELINNLNCLRWTFNCHMLVIKSCLIHYDKKDAIHEISKAMKIVEALQDENKIEFLVRCLDAIKCSKSGDLSSMRELENREKEITEMMGDSHMKSEATHLFKQISAMPPTRRMTVVPGIKLVTSKPDTKAFKTNTIMPKNGSECELQQPTKDLRLKEILERNCSL